MGRITKKIRKIMKTVLGRGCHLLTSITQTNGQVSIFFLYFRDGVLRTSVSKMIFGFNCLTELWTRVYRGAATAKFRLLQRSLWYCHRNFQGFQSSTSPNKSTSSRKRYLAETETSRVVAPSTLLMTRLTLIQEAKYSSFSGSDSQE